jgi:hypothetical protein
MQFRCIDNLNGRLYRGDKAHDGNAEGLGGSFRAVARSQPEFRKR